MPAKLSREFDHVSRRSNQPRRDETYHCRYCSASFDAADADDFVDHVCTTHARETLSANGPFGPSKKDIRRRRAGACLTCGAPVEFTPARPCGQLRISCSQHARHGYYLAGTIEEVDD